MARSSSSVWAASFVYIVNDWRDRDEDARHPTKSGRPLASGAVSGRTAALVAGLCLAVTAAATVIFGFNSAFVAVIACYILINLAYSFGLRRVALIDVFVISAGFVLRILAGTTAIDVDASQFLILSGGLLALLLAFGKRRSDLTTEPERSRPSLTGYSIEFIDVALATLSAAVIGFYCLYTVSDYAVERYGTDSLYVTTFFVVAGVLRYLQVVVNGTSTDGPTEIALKDRFIQGASLLWVLSFLLIGYVF